MTSYKRHLGVGLLGLTLLASCNAADTSDHATSQTKDNKEAMSYTQIDYTTPGQTDEDHIYLEEVLGEAALAEVRNWNERSLARLESDPRFTDMEAEALAILNSKDKIPYVSYRGGQVHNFWQDETHVRGVWRMTTLEDYLTDSPSWETILDIDALAEDEGKNWVFKGNNCLAPDYHHCIVNLSDVR